MASTASNASRYRTNLQGEIVRMPKIPSMRSEQHETLFRIQIEKYALPHW